MSDEREFQEWVQTVGRRHGFTSGANEPNGTRPAESGAADGGLDQRMREHNARLMQQLEERRARASSRVAELRAQGFDARAEENPDGSIVILGERDRIPASSDADSDFAALDQEAHGLHQRVLALTETLRTAVHRSEHVDFENRVNVIFGRLRDPANEGSAEELRRVISDQRELVADMEARLREVERGTGELIGDLAAGRAGEPAEVQEREADSTEQASGRTDADFQALDREARSLFDRARSTAVALGPRLQPAERREVAAAMNGFHGRIRDRANQGNAQESRRVIADLRALIQDLERRTRELDRAPDARTDQPEVAGDPSSNPSARPEATYAELTGEARELHAAASTLYERIAPRLPEPEHADLRARINAFNGRIRPAASQSDPEELRRVIADVRALIADLGSRERELG